MKIKWILIFLVIYLLAPTYALAKQSTSIQKLDEISDEALQMVKFERYDDAEKLLNYFSDQMAYISGNQHSFTLDQLRIVTVSHDEALEAVSSPYMNYEERMNRLTKFRLVIDAVATNHEPLWTEMEDQIMSTFHQMKEAAIKSDVVKFNKNFNTFLSLYNVIYPSMKVDVPAGNIQKLDTRINFIDEFRSQMIGNSQNIKEINNLGDDLKSLFDSMNEDQTDPSLWWVIISTGSIIIMTLSYVGFRKYKGDKEMKKNRSRQLKD